MSLLNILFSYDDIINLVGSVLIPIGATCITYYIYKLNNRKNILIKNPKFEAKDNNPRNKSISEIDIINNSKISIVISSICVM